jgi:hypothetical protein
MAASADARPSTPRRLDASTPRRLDADRVRFGRPVALAALVFVLASGSASAQLTYYVNARTGVVPGGAGIRGNMGYFDVANLPGTQENASIAAVLTFNENPGGHYINPMVRDYRLIAFSGQDPNPAIDRVLNGAVLTPGQQLADKSGLARVFNHPTIFAALGADSDSGAHENQGN